MIGPLRVQKKSYIVYLFTSKKLDGDGRRWKYVGSTSRGSHRYWEHLVEGKGKGRVADWLRWEVFGENSVPDYVILEEASSVKEMQMLEFLHEQAQRRMGEKLMNVDTCGAPTGNRTGTLPEDQEFSASQWPEVKALLSKRIHDPSEGAARHYEFLKNMRLRFGSFNEELEKEMALEAVRYITAPVEVVSTKPEVVTEGKRICLTLVDGELCKTPHHAKGLCRPHYEERRKELKALVKSTVTFVEKDT